ncbi:MAG: PTS sugar transporter subunit IIA [Planctomycetes bacterium]|nr:PTS sugar transporter subunit IIA [Planctomycetota bacterium]
MQRRKDAGTRRRTPRTPVPSPELAAFFAAVRREGLDPTVIRALTEAIRTLGGEAFGDAVRDLRGGKPAGAGRPLRLGSLATRILPRLVWCGARARSKREILRQMVRGVARIHPEIDPAACLESLLAREADASTGVGCGIALPHVSMPGLREERVAVATLRHGVRWDAIQKEPVRIVFLILGGQTDGVWRLAILARIARIVCRIDARRKLLGARSAASLLAVLRDLDDAVA